MGHIKSGKCWSHFPESNVQNAAIIFINTTNVNLWKKNENEGHCLVMP
jgi:hypothetical protein